jgi:hypothetical protein
MLTQALQLAAKAHDRQARKYTGDPYIVHPVEVMGLLLAHIAAILTITARKFWRLPCFTMSSRTRPIEAWQDRVRLRSRGCVSYVEGLTDVYVAGYRDEKTGKKLNRAERKGKRGVAAGAVRKHRPDDQVRRPDLQLADHRRVRSVEFAKTYIPEKRRILSGLLRAESNLWMLAIATLEQAEARLAA